ncbi:MAG: ArsS family sensor histidine kinase [Campylobacter sp.]|nr:ArsS family sensor histidine kinase [Campylobacter sp.]
MKRFSIFYTIAFIFVLTFVSIILAFSWLKSYDKQNYTSELNTRYSIIARLTLFNISKLMSDEEYQSQMKDFEVINIEDESEKNRINENSKVLEEIKTELGTAAILVYEKYNYLKISHGNSVVLLKDAQYQPFRYQIINLIYAFVLLVVFASYFFVYKKLKPLKEIKKQIDKISIGNLIVDKISTGSDEISEIGEALYDSAIHIRKLNESRQLFLRNIMHELKTPITKGRITVEMIDDGKQKDRLINVFERLETLINEFAAVERVTSGVQISDITTHKISEIIEQAKSVSMIDDESIELVLDQDFTLNVDFRTFSVAVKNMIDNAVKYSPDKKVTIIADKDSLKFKSYGKPLEKELSFYTEAFTKGKNAKQSFGLGLYIVDNVLKSHSMKLNYQHKNGINIFIFENLQKIISVVDK